VIRKSDRVSKESGESPPLQGKQLWERTFNSVPDLIAILDRDHRVLQVNRALAERLGRAAEECVGLLCYEAVHGLDQPPFFCPHALTMIDGEPHTAEVHEERLGGDFLVTTTPLCDEAGRVIGSVHVGRDITEQKQAHDSLQHMLEVSEHERQLIGYEIHDGLAQQLAAAMMQFEVFDGLKDGDAERAAKAHALGLQLMRDAHAEVRQLIGRLRPPQLEEGGIVPSIEGLIRESGGRHKIKIEFCSNAAELIMPPMLENTVFRIVQECVSNACRHSKSKRVKVELTHHDDQLRIEVHDWGVGFQVDRVPEGHFGLEGIQERAKVFGGSVRIKSSAGKGTDIVVELPVHGSAAPREAEVSSRPLCRG
jgi:PAS domain S-box-containing protein